MTTTEEDSGESSILLPNRGLGRAKARKRNSSVGGIRITFTFLLLMQPFSLDLLYPADSPHVVVGCDSLNDDGTPVSPCPSRSDRLAAIFLVIAAAACFCGGLAFLRFGDRRWWILVGGLLLLALGATLAHLSFDRFYFGRWSWESSAVSPTRTVATLQRRM